MGAVGSLPRAEISSMESDGELFREGEVCMDSLWKKRNDRPGSCDTSVEWVEAWDIDGCHDHLHMICNGAAVCKNWRDVRSPNNGSTEAWNGAYVVLRSEL